MTTIGDPRPAGVEAPGTIAEGQAPDFDPADHTLAEVNAHLAANPDDTDRVLTLERTGKNRASLVG